MLVKIELVKERANDMLQLIEGAGQVHVAERLELESLPKGQISRLLVSLTHDGLARPVQVPVLVARGSKSGPVFGITAAVHGNELNGIPVIHGLFEKLNAHTLRGCIVAVLVSNIPGYLMQQRRFEDDFDLNLIMPGRENGNASGVYAHRFLDRIVKHFDYLIDLHTASFGRMNSLYIRADMLHPITSQMAYLQRPQIILHNPPSDYTLRGTAMEMGIPAITVEIGNPHRFHPEYVKRSLRGVRAVLAEVGMIPKRPMAEGKPPILCQRSYRLFTDCGGLLRVFPHVTDTFEAGDVIAELRNIYGDVIREYRAPEAGIVIGKNVNPVAQTGARLFHLGVLATEENHFIPRKPWKIPIRDSQDDMRGIVL